MRLSGRDRICSETARRAESRVRRRRRRVAASLDDLEEKAFGESARIQLKVLALAVPVVEDVDSASCSISCCDQGRIAPAGPRSSSAGIGRRLEAVFAQPPRGREDIVRRKRDVLHARTHESLQESRRQRLRRCRAIERDTKVAVRRLDGLAIHQPEWICDLDLRRLGHLEQRQVVQQPREHLLVLHGLRHIVDAQSARHRARCG